MGQAAEITRTFSVADLLEFRDLSGDTNPAFSDSSCRAGVRRGARLACLQVPGGLLGGLFSPCWGHGCRGAAPTGSEEGRLFFPAPCYAGQEVTARVEIIRLRP